MASGDRPGETGTAGGGPGRGRSVPDADHYLDLAGVEDEDPGPHFDVVLRGYDRRQVDDHVAGLRRMVSQLRAQLAVRERRRSSSDTAARAESRPPAAPAVPVAPSAPAPGEPHDGDDLGAFNDRLRGILQAAEQEAQMVRSRAAETLLAEHAESRAALADLRTQRDAVVDELVRLRGWLDEIVSHPGRVPTAPPPVLTPGPPRGGPWSGVVGPPSAPPPPPPPPHGPPPRRGGGRYVPPPPPPEVAATEPSTTEPSATEPPTTEPSTTEPSTEPGTAEPGAVRPGGTAPGDPGTVDHAALEAGTDGHVAVDPRPVDREALEAGTDGHAAVEPEPRSDESVVEERPAEPVAEERPGAAGRP